MVELIRPNDNYKSPTAKEDRDLTLCDICLKKIKVENCFGISKKDEKVLLPICGSCAEAINKYQGVVLQTRTKNQKQVMWFSRKAPFKWIDKGKR